MASKDTAIPLYGAPRRNKSHAKEISSSSTLNFTSQLSSLITASKSSDAPTSKSSTGRQRPKKEDIFTKHNKGSKKRALADLEEDDFTKQKHSTSSEAVDEAQWRRAKRKMEEKARLYDALKRGDLEDVNDKYGVDFDRKWAEAQERGDKDEEISDNEDDDSGKEEEEMVEYIDEFGRLRRGTKAEAKIQEKINRAREMGVDHADRFTARPTAPENVIWGDTVQTAAFNPDETIAQKMADIAQKRDRSLTPPPDTHFDARQEVRQKGQGFFQFSADEETRKKEFANLEKERVETERRRQENADRKEKRKKEVEERRKAIQQKRGKAEADKFLDGLMGELGESKAEEKGDD
ncbi:hypothetical protein NA57DRAFT_41037 [Rhizodiscina lignyota]|uniref:Uncharacterized protein n=1 Tax=Rhizodiscina lignyota TaxID=1504668 RepID=A0A9P4IDI7_9PEZI|nr:hypothetical protein NA57DRAFT_41037 [Rhizodiscina lignyota]